MEPQKVWYKLVDIATRRPRIEAFEVNETKAKVWAKNPPTEYYPTRQVALTALLHIKNMLVEIAKENLREASEDVVYVMMMK